jgi:hypothetical protein
MSMDIFIRSYRGDFEWLEYCLRSLKKYAHGFGKVHIVIPASDLGAMPAVDGEVHVVEGWEDGYLQQQNDKLHCDMYCSTPYVMVLDSDCLLTKDLRPEDLMEGGKPVWLYESVPDGATPWPPITQEVVGFAQEYDFMRRMPFVFSRQSLRDFRAFMFNRFNQALHVTIKARPYRSFSEFNAFGAWAYRHYYEHFEWKSPHEFPTYMVQKWSWGGLTPEIRGEFEKILADWNADY